MNDLRIGIIGAGARMSVTTAAHQPGKGSQVVAIADPKPEAIEKARKCFGSDVFAASDWRHLLDRSDIDAFFVVTPDFLHEEQTIAVLETNRPVFCEKPLAISIEGCDRMLATAQRVRQRLFVGHNMRYMDFTRSMKSIIERGDIGEVKAIWVRHFVSYGGDAYFKDWHSEQKYSHGLLLQKGAHDIDIIHWLANSYTKRVSAFGNLGVYDKAAKRVPEDGPYIRGTFPNNWPPLSQRGMSQIIDVEDLSIVNMQLESGVLATYQQCHYTPDSCRNYTVIGTHGRIENYGDYGDECTVNVWNRRTDSFRLPDATYRMPKLDGDHGGADARIAREFVSFAKNGGKTYASAIAARNSVATGCRATDSLRANGQPYDIPKLDQGIIDYFESL